MPLVKIDSRLVAEALVNIVENAAKYSPPGTEIKLEAVVNPLATAVEHGSVEPGSRTAAIDPGSLERASRTATVEPGSVERGSVERGSVENGSRTAAVEPGPVERGSHAAAHPPGAGSSFRASEPVSTSEVRAGDLRTSDVRASEVRASEARTGELVITVSDTGPGIAPEELDRIFDKFYRSPSVTDADTVGTGMGLAISRGIIVAHRGRLWADSSRGHGTVFTLAIPVEYKAPGSTESDPDPDESGSAESDLARSASAESEPAAPASPDSPRSAAS
jgi:signal transduction histidine kinase